MGDAAAGHSNNKAVITATAGYASIAVDAQTAWPCMQGRQHALCQNTTPENVLSLARQPQTHWIATDQVPV